MKYQGRGGETKDYICPDCLSENVHLFCPHCGSIDIFHYEPILWCSDCEQSKNEGRERKNERTSIHLF
jgi:hypothetical protein